MQGMYEHRSPRPPSYSPTPIYPSKFHRRPSTSQYSQADLFPAYRRSSRHHYPAPAYSIPRPSVERQGWLSSRAHVPALQPASRKTDLTKHHSEPGTFRTMFRQFQYPAKVPAIPDRIHRGQQPRGRINITVNEAEMHPSYVSHQTSRLLTPESLSEDSEEELLLRAEEGSSDGVSEPPSLTESDEDQMSREEQQFEQAPPYQAMEEEHYRSFRSTSSRPASVLSSKSVQVQVEIAKPKKKKKKKPKVSPPSSLSPLHEEEEKPKPSHKAKAPPAFPAHQSPQFIPQPIIYQMPQPFPMPFPIYPPNPQYYYQPYYQSPQPTYRPPSPERPAPVVNKRERSTQYITATKADQKPVDPPTPRPPLFQDVLVDIDRRLTTPVPDTADVKYRKAVALEIGIGETKSLAERFQQKLPSVSAKLNSRDSERPRLEHRDKSNTELLEIRKEMLKHGNSPRASIVEEAPWRGDAAQIEKADRLAAGNSSVTKRQGQDGEERGRRSGLGRPVVVVTDSGLREEAVRQVTEKTVSKPIAKPSAVEKPLSGGKTESAIQKPGTEIKPAELLTKAGPLGKPQGPAPAKVENPPPKSAPELPSPAKPGLKPGSAKPESATTVISGSIQLGPPSTTAKFGAAPKSAVESLPIAKPGPAQLVVSDTSPVKAGVARQESASLAGKQGPKLGPDKLVPAKAGFAAPGADTPAKAGERVQTLPSALTPKAVLEALSPKAGVSSAANAEPSKSVLAKPSLTSSGSNLPAITRPEERIQTLPTALTPRAVLEALSPKAGAKPGPADILSKPGLRIPTSETPASTKEKAPGFEALATKASTRAEPRPGTDTPSSVVSSRSTAGLMKAGSDTPKPAALGALKSGAEESKQPAGRPVKMQ